MLRQRTSGKRVSKVSGMHARGFTTEWELDQRNDDDVRNQIYKENEIKSNNVHNVKVPTTIWKINVLDKADLFIGDQIKGKDGITAIELYSEDPGSYLHVNQTIYNCLKLPSVTQNEVELFKPFTIIFNGRVITGTAQAANTSAAGAVAGIAVIKPSPYDPNVMIYNASYGACNVSETIQSQGYYGHSYIHNYTDMATNGKYFVRLLPTPKAWFVLACNFVLSFADRVNNDAEQHNSNSIAAATTPPAGTEMFSKEQQWRRSQEAEGARRH